LSATVDAAERGLFKDNKRADDIIPAMDTAADAAAMAGRAVTGKFEKKQSIVCRLTSNLECDHRARGHNCRKDEATCFRFLHPHEACVRGHQK